MLSAMLEDSYDRQQLKGGKRRVYGLRLEALRPRSYEDVNAKVPAKSSPHAHSKRPTRFEGREDSVMGYCRLQKGVATGSSNWNRRLDREGG